MVGICLCLVAISMGSGGSMAGTCLCHLITPELALNIFRGRAAEMASISKLQIALFLVAAVLLLVCSRGQAARPVPGSSVHMSQRDSAASVHEKSGSGMGMSMDQEEPEATSECEGGEEREECLMRRTLIAHTDYIYTQGKHN
ncbi:hypothetical protein ACP4OV_015587 [Aristida adscensionis]